MNVDGEIVEPGLEISAGPLVFEENLPVKQVARRFDWTVIAGVRFGSLSIGRLLDVSGKQRPDGRTEYHITTHAIESARSFPLLVDGKLTLVFRNLKDDESLEETKVVGLFRAEKPPLYSGSRKAPAAA